MTEPPSWQRVESLFHRAVTLPPAAREAWLRQAAGPDEALVAEVLALIAADAGGSGGVVSQAVAEALAMGGVPATPGTGRQVGSYRLLRELGHGGMGTVFLAERIDEAYRALVAIKFVRDRLGGPELLRRLLAERQILADLAHPNIARLLDGGSTEDGTPYLVLEYIDGVPVDRHCADQRLDLRGRLQLFLRICGAVQYAHQALVIHRDLKPSNILVTDDGTPKLVDFGIAKVLAAGEGQETQTGLLAMTPAYASPEQVRGQRVTVATDIYSLGVVLHLLLAGELPIALPPGAPIAEIVRRVQDEEPKLPSVVAATPWKLDLRGDLDAILLRALAKEPERRYPTVEQFAADLHRHLEGEPVRARPATALYRLGRWARRNRPLAATGLVALLALGGGLTVALWQRNRAEAARVRTAAALAQSNATRDFLLDLFRANDPGVARGRELTARDLMARGLDKVDDLTPQPALQGEVLYILGRIESSLSDFQAGADLLRRAIEVHRRAGSPDSVFVDVYSALGNAMYDLGWPDSAAAAWQAAVDLGRSDGTEGTDAVLGALGNLGIAYARLGQVERAESTYRHLIDVERRVLGPDHADRAYALNNLGLLLTNQGRFTEAEPLLRETLALQLASGGDSTASVGFGYDNLGVMLRDAGRYEEAEPLLRDGLALRLRLLGPEHRFTGESFLSLGRLLALRGRPADLAEADSALHRALATYHARLGAKHPAVAYVYHSLGQLAVARHDLPDAERWFRQALDLRRQNTGRDNPAVTVESLVALGHVLRALGRRGEAAAAFASADSLARARLPHDHFHARDAQVALALSREDAGVPDAGLLFAEGVAHLAARVGPQHPMVVAACERGAAAGLFAPETCR